MKNKVMMPTRYEGYSVDEDGKLYSHKSGRYLTPFDNGHGYLYYNIQINGKGYKRRANVIAAEAYIPKPDWWTPGMKLIVGHKNDVRNDNRIENLEWITQKENLDTDSYREKAKCRIRSQVMCVETGDIFKSIAEAARQMDIGRHNIGNVLCGKQKTAGGYHWVRVEEEVSEH